MTILLLKVTLLLLAPLACLPMMRRASSAMRHLVCAVAMGGALLLPLTLLLPRASTLTIRAGGVAYGISHAARGAASVPWLGLWIAGACILLARIAVGYRVVSRVVRRAERRNGFMVAEVVSPMVVGLWKPVILVPRDWPADRLDAALRHEQAHVDRYDLWTNLMAHVGCAVYWFHPLMWAVADRMRREQEAACDDAVLCSGVAPVVYAEALVAAARQFTLESTSSMMGCQMLNRKSLKNRIARLLDGSLPRMSSTGALRRTAIVLFAALGCIALLNAADEQVLKVGVGVSPPQLVSRLEPDYTPEAKAARVEGAVLLSVIVGSDGVAHDINVLKSLDAGLDVKAAEAVQKWHFRPGMKDGVAVAVRATIEVNFRLL